MNSNWIRFTAKDGFEVKDPDTGGTVFTTDFSKLKFPEKTGSIKVNKMNTHRVLLIWLLLFFVTHLSM